MCMNRPCARRAFSLVELIVVIVVLGILAGVAIPKYNNYRDAAKLRANVANIRAITGTFRDYCLYTYPQPSSFQYYAGEAIAIPELAARFDREPMQTAGAFGDSVSTVSWDGAGSLIVEWEWPRYSASMFFTSTTIQPLLNEINGTGGSGGTASISTTGSYVSYFTWAISP